MRLHRNLVLAVIRVLDGVFNQDLYADKTIEKILKQDKRLQLIFLKKFKTLTQHPNINNPSNFYAKN